MHICLLYVFQFYLFPWKHTVNDPDSITNDYCYFYKIERKKHFYIVENINIRNLEEIS